MQQCMLKKGVEVPVEMLAAMCSRQLSGSARPHLDTNMPFSDASVASRRSSPLLSTIYIQIQFHQVIPKYPDRQSRKDIGSGTRRWYLYIIGDNITDTFFWQYIRLYFIVWYPSVFPFNFPQSESKTESQHWEYFQHTVGQIWEQKVQLLSDLRPQNIGNAVLSRSWNSFIQGWWKT